MGTTEVPVAPERVVALAGICVANLASLGLTPVVIDDQVARQISVYEEWLPPSVDLSNVPATGSRHRVRPVALPSSP